MRDRRGCYTHKMRCLLLLAMMLILPQAAHAAKLSPESTVDDPQIVRWLNIAEDHWQRGPHCERGITVQLGNKGSNRAASARLGGCTIWLNPAYYSERQGWNRAMCQVIAHEWGHLLGYEHSNDPHHLMYHSGVPAVVAACPRASVSGGPHPSFTDVPEGEKVTLAQFSSLQRDARGRRLLVTTIANTGPARVSGLRVCQRWSGSLRAYQGRKTQRCVPFSLAPGEIRLVQVTLRRVGRARGAVTVRVTQTAGPPMLARLTVS